MAASTFQGEKFEKPIKFLKEMRRYLNPNEMSLNDMKIMLSQNLKGSAASWWYVVENSIQDFEDFEEQFKKKFWSKEITDALVRKIEYGVYASNGPLSRVDYTIELMSVAQDLEKYTEEELVKKLVAHHDMDIRFMAKSQNIKEKKALMSLLQCKDAESRRERRPRYSNNSEQRDRPVQERRGRETRNNVPARNYPSAGNYPPQRRENEHRSQQRPPGRNENGSQRQSFDGHALDRQISSDSTAECGIEQKN